MLLTRLHFAEFFFFIFTTFSISLQVSSNYLKSNYQSKILSFSPEYQLLKSTNHNSTHSQLIANCGGTFKSHQTIITTPNYPGSYPSNINCEYVFKSPYVCKNQFHVQFLDFVLESSPSCAKDKLTVENAETLCGQIIGTNIYNTTNGILRMIFHSDSEGVTKGFRLLVTRLPCQREHTQGELEASHNTSLITTQINQRQLIPDLIGGRSKNQFNNSKQYLPPANVYVPNIPEYVPDYYSPQYPSYYSANAPYLPVFICIPQPGQQFPQNIPTPNTPPNFTPFSPQLPPFPSVPAKYPEISFNNFNNQLPLPVPAPESYNPHASPFNPPTTNNNLPQFPMLPKVEPQVAPSLPGTIAACCTRTFTERRFYLSSPDFPSFNSNPTDCLFYVEKFGPNTCRLRIELKYFAMGVANPQGCFDDFLEIDGQRICGCRTGLIYTSQWGLGAKVLRVRTSGARNGEFLVELIQEDCPYRYRGDAFIQKRIDEPLRSALVETNSTMRALYRFYGEGRHEQSAAIKDEDSTEGPSSQFLLGPFNSNRCSFTFTDWLRLSVDPLWIARPRCS